MLVVELGEAGGHLAAAGAGGRHHDEGVAGLDVVVLAQALLADDEGDVGGVAGDGIVPEAADAQGLQAVQEGVRRPLAAVLRQHHGADVEAEPPEDVDEPQHVVIVADAEVPPHLVLLDVRGVDGDDDLHVLPQLLEHTDLAVRLEARQDPGGVIVVKELAAELQVELAAELADALLDLLGLDGEVFLIIKTDGCHKVIPTLPLKNHTVLFYHTRRRSGALGRKKMPGEIPRNFFAVFRQSAIDGGDRGW